MKKISEQKVLIMLGHLGIMFTDRSYGKATTGTICLETLMRAIKIAIDNPEILLEDEKKII